MMLYHKDMVMGAVTWLWLRAVAFMLHLRSGLYLPSEYLYLNL